MALVNSTTDTLKKPRKQQDRQSLVLSPFTTAGQETERVCSFNPRSPCRAPIATILWDQQPCWRFVVLVESFLNLNVFFSFLSTANSLLSLHGFQLSVVAALFVYHCTLKAMYHLLYVCVQVWTVWVTLAV